MTWTFYINNTEVDEPQGFNDLVLNIKRDDQWHGIFFEASTSVLTFYGTAATLLKTEKQQNGLASSATFRAEADCGDGVDVIEGNFDFGTYTEKCGSTCTVEISIEKTGCIMTLRNRYDQKVDMQKTTAFDNTTLLQDYTALDINIDLTAQKLSFGAEAEMQDTDMTELISSNINWTDSDGFNNYIGWIAPPFPNVTNDSLGEFNASSIIDLAGPLEGVPNRPPYPNFPNAVGTATLLGDITCELTDTNASFRLKGSATCTFSGSAAVSCTAKLMRLPSGLDGTVAANWTEMYATVLFARTTDGTTLFDLQGVLPVPLAQGDFIYFGLSTRGDSLNNISSFSLTFNPESYYKLLSTTECETTTADVSLVNEFGSRIIESITDGCLQMKSDYYGREDSQPYVSTADGCGSLRVLSNGLKIRNATTSNHFCSLNDFYDGLRGIDNIGMGIEDNTVITTKQWLRVEPVAYFYQDVKVFEIDSITDASRKLEPSMGYSKIMIGYQKWEVETVNGLNEFNSNKEFRTNLSTIKNELDATSPFVAGGIPIEVTRIQSFATSGSADTKYDNETFIICVERSGYSYIVEKDNIGSALNIFSPETAYNWRIRPMYNLMRWFKSIAQTYVNISNTVSKLFFSSGTGNYIASGEAATYDSCRLESSALAENNDLWSNNFQGTDYLPLYMPETISFTYPLSVRDYLLLKASPYGYIEYQCGNGIFEKGFIKSIEYRPARGEAQFTLIKKWP